MKSEAYKQTGETLLDHTRAFGRGDIETVSERRSASVPKVVQNRGSNSREPRCVAAKSLVNVWTLHCCLTFYPANQRFF
jgi:hypothetical protein